MIAKVQEVRLPAVAGSFYPVDRESLAREVDGYLNCAGATVIDEEIVGLIVPHAGYLYSGEVAGHAYHLLEGQSFDTVVLIGLSHHVHVHGASIVAKGMFRTPLGDLKINEAIANQILALHDDAENTIFPHQKEHCLEVQLPFLQRILPPFRIVPILLQDDSPENVTRLSNSIAAAVAGDILPHSRHYGLMSLS